MSKETLKECIGKGFEKTQKLVLSLAIVATILLLTLSNVSALGISPGRTTMDFSPGAEKTVSFSVINSENKDINIVIAAQGELKDYIQIQERAFAMSSSESSREVTYKVKLPNELSPGLHTAEIVVLQLPEEGKISEAYIGAALAVVTQLYVYVPYPGKYAEASLNVIGPDDNGIINFVIPVISRGEFDLTKVWATIDIYSSLNEKITTITTNEASIPSGQRREIVAKLDASEMPNGPYRAVATVIYDEGSLKLETDFKVGKRILSLESIEVNDFVLGEIAKFEILVENKWSETIKGAYAEMFVYSKDGRLMANFKTPTYNIEPLTKALMIAYWDTAGVREGVYDSEILLKYGGSSDKKELKLDVSENDIKVIGLGYVISARKPSGTGETNSRLIIILIALVVVLILLNLLWFMLLRRKFMK